MTKAQSEARRKDWQDGATRDKRIESIRRGALRRYEDPEERYRASEQAKRLYDDEGYARRNREHLDRLNKARRGKPAGALGMSRSPEYKVWAAMVQRCHNPKSKSFHNYGGRGITVCGEWRGRDGFARFYEHVGTRPAPDMTVERIDNDRGYEPSNVRWATRQEQAENSRRVRLVTIGSETKHLAEWARIAGVSPPSMAYRILASWPEDRLLDQPGR